MARLHLDKHDVGEVAAVMTRLGHVCVAIECELNRGGSGRPRQWTAYGMIAGWILLARHGGQFHIEDVERLAGTLTAAQRRSLGLNRDDHTDPSPFTTRQNSYAWSRICRAIDPAQPGLSREEQERRLELFHWVNTELLMATVPRSVRRAWKGDLALDATLVWSHGRPPRTLKDKLYANGKDGDGVPTFISKAEPSQFDEADEDNHPFLGQLEPNTPAAEEFHSNGRRKRKDRRRRAVGARWIGNKHFSKVVHGYAHHAAVIVSSEGEPELPLMAIGQITTPSTSNPAQCGRMLVESIATRTGAEEDGGQLGDVLADGGYSQAKPEHWTLPLRAQGAEPIFRLHGTNQEGHRGAIRGGNLLQIDGRYYCSCLPDHLRQATYPHTPTHDVKVNTRKKAAYRAVVEARKPFELKQRAKAGQTGLRFDTPHNGNCPECAGSAQQCCTTKTINLTWEQLGTYQRHQFGSESWEKSYSRRSRVEGYFGSLKNPRIGTHHRSAGFFYEYAKVSLTFTLNAIATNLYLLAKWRRRTTVSDRANRSGRPRTNPTLHEIAANPDLLEERRKRRKRIRRPTTKPPRAKPKPNPFAHLGDAPL